MGIAVIFAYYIGLYTAKAMAKGALVSPTRGPWLPNLILGFFGLVVLLGGSPPARRSLQVTLPSLLSLVNRFRCGADAAKVAAEAVAAMDKCNDMYEAEKIHINFRLACKPPVMPVNFFLDTDRQLGTKLMELRNTDYYKLSVEELPKCAALKSTLVSHQVQPICFKYWPLNMRLGSVF